MTVFNAERREALREALLERARHDPRISGAAITGSASVGALDRWSDIDLAFGIRDPADLAAALEDFTAFMRANHGAVDTVDVVRGPWTYRVFLLPDTLQVDLAFAPASAFGPTTPKFRLVFGDAGPLPDVRLPAERELIGLAWLYALHVRSSINRRRPWQALSMLGAMRDQVLGLACLRTGLPASEGRGFDALPGDITQPLEAAVARSLAVPDLVRAFEATVEGLLREVDIVDDGLARTLEPVLRSIVATVDRRPSGRRPPAG